MDDPLADLFAGFLAETTETLADLDATLVQFECTPDDQNTLSRIFRLVHTIKGTGGFFGLRQLQCVTHDLENVLARMRAGAPAITPAHIALVLAGLDRIKAILDSLSAPGGELAADGMQPIGEAWSKLPSLAHDLACDLGKQVELVLHGTETELDRRMLQRINGPLIHMIRNSIDHGLEIPAERRAAGKPETGRITLNAHHGGGHIWIEIADDGSGLNMDRIRAKILANGLATRAQLAGMTDDKIQHFIFRPGFSTADTITAISGRGVGLDVVKTDIDQLGGRIDLESTPGQGTVFTIGIPLARQRKRAGTATAA